MRPFASRWHDLHLALLRAAERDFLPVEDFGLDLECDGVFAKIGTIRTAKRAMAASFIGVKKYTLDSPLVGALIKPLQNSPLQNSGSSVVSLAHESSNDETDNRPQGSG